MNKLKPIAAVWKKIDNPNLIPVAERLWEQVNLDVRYKIRIVLRDVVMFQVQDSVRSRVMSLMSRQDQSACHLPGRQNPSGVSQ